MATHEQGNRVGLTIAILPEQDEALKAIARRNKTKVAPMLRPVIEKFIEENPEPKEDK